MSLLGGPVSLGSGVYATSGLDELETEGDAPRVLVVDDERVIREILSDFLTMEGYLVRTVDDGEAALKELQRRPYNLILSDLKMPKIGGLELLEHMAALKIEVLTVIMTGFGTVETAIEAMKKGAYDYILKPFKVEEVIHVIQRGLDRQRLQAENMRLRETISLYRIAEAMSSNLSVEGVLDLILAAVLDETRADLATLWLTDPATGAFEERSRKVSGQHSVDLACGVHLDAILAHFREDRPLIAHGSRSARFTQAPKAHRVTSFLSVPLKVREQVIGFLTAYALGAPTRGLGRKFDEGHRKYLAIMGSRAAVAIENARLYESLVTANDGLTTANQSLEENFRQTIVGFAHALEESDRYTRGHSDRVGVYAKVIGDGLTLTERESEQLRWAGLLHDIGKIGIRNYKLNKPGKLTPEEMAMFRTHPAKGKRILEPIPSMRDLVPACYCHHEAWDGSGYPEGLEGDRIPLMGRIVAVADAYDAMTSDRAYRKALPHAVAVAELERCAGVQFDAEIVEVFLSRIEEMRKEQARRR